MSASLNTDPPEIRCGMCGGRCRVIPDRVYRRGARVIRCASGFPGEGPCSWSGLDPRRVDPSWYWRLRVRLGR